MDFNPAVHTKEFLINNLEILFSLAEDSSDFAKSNLAADIDVLSQSLPGDEEHGVPASGWRIAHTLASSQPEWLNNEASSDLNVLAIENDDGWTVGHTFAKHRSDWVHTKAAKNPEVLMRRTRSSNSSVLGTLARYQPQWVNKLTVNDVTMLSTIENEDTGLTIADLVVIHQHNAISDELLNDINFLRLRSNQLAPRGLTNSLTHGYLAHLVAAIAERWMQLPAAKSLDVLTMCSDDGFCVAHSLARHQVNWITTDEAKLETILKAKTVDGIAVAHELAITQKRRAEKGLQYVAHPYAESTENLLLMRTEPSGLMYSLANDLSVNDRNWVLNSRAAYSKDVLSMLAVKDTSDNGSLSVGEQIAMHHLPLTDVVMRCIQAGAAFKNVVPSKYKIVKSADIDGISQRAFEFASESSVPEVRLKIYLSLYSTVVHFLDNYADVATSTQPNNEWLISEKSCRGVIARTEEQIYRLLEDNPGLFSMWQNLAGPDSEPGASLIEKYSFKHTLLIDRNNVNELTQTEFVDRGLN